MTPKEKANELINKFLDDKFIGIILEDVEAKQCALISVNEIIENEKVDNIEENNLYFWQEVKQEIEKL